MKGEIKMKRILFAIAIVMMLGLTANAQGKKDAFFNSDWDNNDYNRSTSNNVFPAVLGGQLGGLTGDQNAPLGTGLLVLTALGAGYAVTSKKRR